MSRVTDLSLDARPQRRVRLDARATDLFWNDQTRPDAQKAQLSIMEIVRTAAFVVDAQDQVIKGGTPIPRPATFDEVTGTELIQGERFYG